MQNILQRIVDAQREAVARQKTRLPLSTLKSLVAAAAPPRGFAQALRSSGGAPRIVAEVKRASPSKGVLRGGVPVSAWDPVALAKIYEAHGAAAISVLTNVRYFWGDPDALAAVRQAVSLPVLRKDFIVDPYQVWESRWLGADAILLIVGGIDDALLAESAAIAEELGMAVLVEIHADDELDVALRVRNGLVGINHRNLHTMQMDMERALRLRSRIPPERLVVAESGLQSQTDLQPLLQAGIHAFLIGERLAAAPNPGAVLSQFLAPL